MLLPDISRQILSGGRAANWPVSLNLDDSEAEGLVHAFFACPMGMVDLRTGLLGTRTGTADPKRISKQTGAIDAYFDGTDDQYTWGTSFPSINSAQPFTIVWECLLDSFLEPYQGICYFYANSGSIPIVLFYSNHASYLDITCASTGAGTFRAIKPSEISMTGDRHWGIWSYNGGGASLGNHSIWINGQPSTSGFSTSTSGHVDSTRIGGWSSTSGDFNGSIRQVRFYNRAWTEADAIRFWHPATRDSLFTQERSKAYFFATESGHILAGANCSQSQTSDGGAISQTHLLLGADVTQAATSASGAVEQTHLLTGAGSTQDATSPGGAIILGSEHVLTGANVAQENTTTTGAIGQTHLLAGASVTQGNSSTSGAIGQSHVLLGSGSAQDAFSPGGAIVIGDVHVLSGENAIQLAQSTGGAIVQTHVLAGANCSQDASSPGGVVWQTHLLTGAAATQTNSSSSGALSGAADVPILAVRLRSPIVRRVVLRSYIDDGR